MKLEAYWILTNFTYASDDVITALLGFPTQLQISYTIPETILTLME